MSSSSGKNKATTGKWIKVSDQRLMLKYNWAIQGGIDGSEEEEFCFDFKDNRISHSTWYLLWMCRCRSQEAPFHQTPRVVRYPRWRLSRVQRSRVLWVYSASAFQYRNSQVEAKILLHLLLYGPRRWRAGRRSHTHRGVREDGESSRLIIPSHSFTSHHEMNSIKQ